MITILFAILAVLAILWVVGPVMAEKEPSPATDARPRNQADPARSVLDQITDLDLEHAAGKIPDAAYKQVRADLAVQASAALAERDASFQASSPEAASEGAAAPGNAAAKQAAAGGSGSKKKAASYCPGCGKPATSQDKFCASCGRNLKS